MAWLTASAAQASRVWLVAGWRQKAPDGRKLKRKKAADRRKLRRDRGRRGLWAYSIPCILGAVLSNGIEKIPLPLLERPFEGTSGGKVLCDGTQSRFRSESDSSMASDAALV